MKLKSIVKKMDYIANAELRDVNNVLLWKGDMISLQAASTNKNKFNTYIKECRQDNVDVTNAIDALNFMDWELLGKESIGLTPYVNKHNVNCILVTFYIGEKE